ncbi:sulfatase-like hydrolase/transferase [Paraburkholderia sp. ZP32-5]|uniref:sulfatase-like hydrolase/transferase n=1 Tax=Paraburkholderia sp. ZP32-5 TaxID=2883245 RepID=UPI001F20E3A1|nr:sulfatase-like hydrolase/transferase [Paraburkholderia sp. ZP32-5]
MTQKSDSKPYGGGRVGKTLRDSEPWWPPRKTAPDGAPNVVVILLDDLGFSDFGCYGSEIRTPNIDALAEGGLRFVNYTTVPMCTPARAALLTGCNPHSVGCGWLTHNDPGYPGYRAGEIAQDVPTMAEVLRENGYATYAVGKWHNTADYNVMASGDRESWPLQRGFDRFYGFLSAETNYFAPGQLIDGNTFVDTDTYPADYYCSDDWTDKSIGWLKDHIGSTPDKPFFLYLAHNAPHVPLHAKPEDVERYKHVYAQGWDRLREARFVRQRENGTVPDDWRLSPRGNDIPVWDDLTPAQRQLNERYMRLYAAIVDNIDQNVGRLVAFLRDAGQIDNTLIVITSDNGATSIGGRDGAANIFEKRINRSEPAGLAEQMFKDGRLGGIDSYSAYPVGWGNVSNTPFRFYKRTPMNGGIRVPYVMHWPARVSEPGGIRRDWIHVTDTLPTILASAGITYPASFKGRATRLIDGLSFARMLTHVEALSARRSQHYELEGNRGYIRDQWKIVSLQPPGAQFDLDNWMLFDLERDPTECEDLSARYPDVVAELLAEFEADAQANLVYPLDNRDNRRLLAIPPFLEQRISQPRTFYRGSSTTPAVVISPLIADRDYRIECHFSYQPGQEGVLVAFGNTFGGLSLYVQESRLFLIYNVGQRQSEISTDKLRPGQNVVVLQHEARGERRGVGTLVLNGTIRASEIDMSPTIARLTGEGLDVGCDRRIQVSSRYRDRGAFGYAGDVHFVRLTPGNQAHDSIVNRAERVAQLD